MSSFLLPLTDALAPLPIGPDFSQSALGSALADGAGTPPSELFQQLLEELAAAIDSNATLPVPGGNSNAIQASSAGSNAGAAVGQPLHRKDKAGQETSAEDLDPKTTDATSSAVAFVNLPMPMWTAGNSPRFAGVESMRIVENPEKSLQSEKSGSTEDSGREHLDPLRLSRHTPLFALATELPEAAAEPPSLPAAVHEVVENNPQTQVDLAANQPGLIPAAEAVGPVAMEVDQPEKVQSIPGNPPPVSTPELPPSPPLAQARSETQKVERPPQPRLESPPNALPQDHDAQTSPSIDRRVVSSEDGRSRQPEAFRMLLRDAGANSQPETPGLRVPEVPPDARPAKTEPAAETQQAADSAQQPDLSKPVREGPQKFHPEVAGPAAEVRHDVRKDSAGMRAGQQPAPAPEKPTTVNAVSAAADRGLEHKQGERSAQPREEELIATNRPRPDSETRPLPQVREMQPLAVGDRHSSSRPAASDEASLSATPIQEPASPAPVSRTVQQLRVTLPPSTEGRGVEVLLHQRAGGVEVSVRSSDAQVRETLRSGLSDLIGSFDRKGIAAETLPTLSTGHVSQVEQLAGLPETAAGKALADLAGVENGRQETRDDQQQRQARQPDWQPDGENRRRRDQPAEAWQKYMEENGWHNR